MYCTRRRVFCMRFCSICVGLHTLLFKPCDSGFSWNVIGRNLYPLASQLLFLCCLVEMVDITEIAIILQAGILVYLDTCNWEVVASFMVIRSVFRLEVKVFTLFCKWPLISYKTTYPFSWEDHFSLPCDHESTVIHSFSFHFKSVVVWDQYAGLRNVCADGLECHMLVPMCVLVRNIIFRSKAEDVRLPWDTIGFKPIWWRLNVIPQESCYFGTFFLFRIIHCTSWLLSVSTENIAVIPSCLSFFDK